MSNLTYEYVKNQFVKILEEFESNSSRHFQDLQKQPGDFDYSLALDKSGSLYSEALTKFYYIKSIFRDLNPNQYHDLETDVNFFSNQLLDRSYYFIDQISELSETKTSNSSPDFVQPEQTFEHTVHIVGDDFEETLKESDFYFVRPIHCPDVDIRAVVPLPNYTQFIPVQGTFINVADCSNHTDWYQDEHGQLIPTKDKSCYVEKVNKSGSFFANGRWYRSLLTDVYFSSNCFGNRIVYI